MEGAVVIDDTGHCQTILHIYLQACMQLLLIEIIWHNRGIELITC